MHIFKRNFVSRTPSGMDRIFFKLGGKVPEGKKSCLHPVKGQIVLETFFG